MALFKKGIYERIYEVYCILFCLLILSYSLYDAYAGYTTEKEAVRSRIANTSFLVMQQVIEQ